MNIADDVEGAVIELAVVPQRLPFNGRRINLLLSVENLDVAETLPLQSLQRTSQFLRLVPHHMRTEVSICTIPIAICADPFGQAEDDSDRQNVVLTGQIHQRLGNASGCSVIAVVWSRRLRGKGNPEVTR